MSWKILLKAAIKAGLVEGRHPLPVSEYIFEQLPEEGGLADKIPQLQEKAARWLEDKEDEIQTVKGIVNSDEYVPLVIDLYVTGMTPILTAFLKAWNQSWSRTGTLTLYHYDLSSKTYWSEEW